MATGEKNCINQNTYPSQRILTHPCGAIGALTANIHAVQEGENTILNVNVHVRRVGDESN